MSATTPDAARRVPRLGGFNRTLLRIELMRMMRNRRTVIFALVLPVVFFLMFGPGQKYSNLSAGHGNVTAYVMVSMAIYGAMLSATGGGAMVSVERTQGWSRQLRLTPLHPAAYILTKVVVAMLLGALSILAVFVVGALRGATMDNPARWVACAVIGWLGSITFAAFGVFMGYLLRSENAMQVIGPVLAILAFLGGLFVPLDQMGEGFATVAEFTPMYGLSQLAHAPVSGDAPGLAAVANVVVWFGLFVAGAAWRFSADTRRV